MLRGLAVVVLGGAALLAAGCSSTSGPDEAPPDTNSPHVRIDYPPNNAVIGDSVLVVADATDSRSVAYVEFAVDGAVALADSTSPFEFLWDASSEATASEHVLTARAYDVAGNHAQSEEVLVHCRWRRLIVDGDEYGARDIYFVYVRSSSTLLEFRVGVHGPWEDAHDPETGIDIGIMLDVDRDQSTGLNEDVPGWATPNDIGADFAAGVGWEGDIVWAWSQSDTLWEQHADYAYTTIPDSSSRLDVGLYRADIGDPGAIDVVAIGKAEFFDWAPDAGHVTYYVDGLYVGREAHTAWRPRPIPPHEVGDSESVFRPRAKLD